MSKAQWMQENLKPGEIYAGLILGKEDQPDHHLFLLEAKPTDRLNWEAAKDWAASAGGELPTRSEQSLLFANAKEHFEAAWYWSCEQSAGNPSYAWYAEVRRWRPVQRPQERRVQSPCRPQINH